MKVSPQARARCPDLPEYREARATETGELPAYLQRLRIRLGEIVLPKQCRYAIQQNRCGGLSEQH